jgi:hypothetical protein
MKPDLTTRRGIDAQIMNLRGQISKLDSEDEDKVDCDQIQYIADQLMMLREQRAELARAITLKRMEATA